MAPQEAAVVFCYGGADGGLTQPRGLRCCADGSLLVADFARHCVMRFKPRVTLGKVVAGEDGKALPTVDPLKDIDKPMGPPEGEGFLLKQPGDVSEDSAGNVLVLDTETAKVQRFSTVPAETLVPVSGSLSQKSASAPEAIKNPRGMWRCPDGSVIICDTWSHRVLQFDASSSEPRVLAGLPNSAGARAEQLCFPSSLAMTSDGLLYVADTNNHRIQLFQPGETTGITVAGNAQGKTGNDLASLNMPTGLCLDKDENIYVADRANARVLRFPKGSKGGDAGEVLLGPNHVQRPWGLCISTDGSLFVSDERQGVVLQVEVGSKPDALGLD